MARGKPFVKGQSGNPGGRPKENHELKELAQQYTRAAIEALAEALKDKQQRVAAAVALLDRGHGKPTQPVTVDANRAIAEFIAGLAVGAAAPVPGALESEPEAVRTGSARYDA